MDTTNFFSPTNPLPPTANPKTEPYEDRCYSTIHHGSGDSDAGRTKFYVLCCGKQLERILASAKYIDGINTGVISG